MKNNLEPREEIESIIKQSAIDRKRFFEVDKFSYKAIQNKVIAKFINIERQFDFNLHRGYLRYNPKLRYIEIGYRKSSEWWEWFRLLPQILKGSMDAVYVIFVGDDYTWVYEGYIPELIEILFQGSPIGDGDCYIVSKKYEWLIGYSDDGDVVTCVDNGTFFDMDMLNVLENIKICLRAKCHLPRS